MIPRIRGNLSYQLLATLANSLPRPPSAPLDAHGRQVPDTGIPRGCPMGSRKKAKYIHTAECSTDAGLYFSYSAARAVGTVSSIICSVHSFNYFSTFVLWYLQIHGLRKISA